MPDSATSSCATCSKTATTDGTPLQRCGGCQSVHYCSKDCQKVDWKTHKRACQPGGTPKADKPPISATKSTMESFLGLDTKSMLTNLPEERVYTFLIDSYRLRMEDEHMYRGDVDEDSLYGGGNPLKGFARFLKRAEKRDGVLPKWWSEEKRKGCIAKGDAEDHWSCLHVSVDKEDVIEHYNNGMAPMQLRMLAEEILGSNVMNG